MAAFEWFDAVAPFAGAAALVGDALIAARTANTRQRRELAHDRDLRDMEKVREALTHAA